MTDPRHLFEPLPARRFGVIYADPPWDYGGRRQHDSGEYQKRKDGSPAIEVRESGGADVHYPTVRLDDLRRLDVASIAAPDSLLFMWATSPHLDQSIDLLKFWGFQYVTVGFVWDKRRPNPGYYTMSRCETEEHDGGRSGGDCQLIGQLPLMAADVHTRTRKP